MENKKKLKLLVDIGNSKTLLAEYDSAECHRAIARSSEIKTSKLKSYLVKFKADKFSLIVIASVVPEADKLFFDFENVVFINYKNIPLLKINLKSPEQVGADRIVNALAAYQITKTSTLIIDSGTATTFCYVDKKGVYQGGAIIPGMELSSKALNDYTAKIPLIWVKPTQALFGKDTKEAVQTGIFREAIFTINGFIAEYKKMDSKLKVVGTGRGLETLKDYIKLDLYDPELILKGLAICSDYE